MTNNPTQFAETKYGASRIASTVGGDVPLVLLQRFRSITQIEWNGADQLRRAAHSLALAGLACYDLNDRSRRVVAGHEPNVDQLAAVWKERQVALHLGRRHRLSPHWPSGIPRLLRRS